jgi:hypothetical protein
METVSDIGESASLEIQGYEVSNVDNVINVVNVDNVDNVVNVDKCG